MQNDLIKLLEIGWSVHFEWHAKRMDGNFDARAVWRAEIKGNKFENDDWEGFKTQKECVEDFVNFATSKNTVDKYQL